MRLVMLGPPGSGKGTQAKIITQKHGIPQISTGDLLRAAIKEGTDLGLKAKTFIDEGKLVPDNLVLQLLKARIQKEDCKSGFILDGYPRNLTQAKQLNSITDIDLVINIDVDNNIILERITGRRTCKNCDEIFHIIYNPPKEEMICDKCSGKLYQRDDDTEDTVKKRLATYEEQTKPLIEFYTNKKKLKTLKSDGTIEEMSQKVKDLLNHHFHYNIL